MRKVHRSEINEDEVIMIRVLLQIAVSMALLASVTCIVSADTTAVDGGVAQAFALIIDGDGELRVGLSQDEVERRIPCRSYRGEEIFEGATGEYVQEWEYPRCGLVLIMSAKQEGTPQKIVRSIIVTSPGTVRTKKGIHIVSPEEDVVQSYGPDQNSKWTDGEVAFVVGSIYDGIVFKFAHGRVYEIFLGSAAV